MQFLKALVGKEQTLSDGFLVSPREHKYSLVANNDFPQAEIFKACVSIFGTICKLTQIKFQLKSCHGYYGHYGTMCRGEIDFVCIMYSTQE